MRRILPRRTAGRALAGVCAAALATAVPLAAYAGSGGRLVHRTNLARENHDLRSYRDRLMLTDMAQRWAGWMADHRSVMHNPDLEQQAGNWCWLGENVGTGGSARMVQREFMHSVDHRANILSTRYTQVGIGAAWGSGGHLYVDEVFRRPC
jgi:uncharacterized protein YkwD